LSTTDTPEIEDLTLDANAVGGLLMEIFGTDMTAAASQCAHCGNRGEVATLRAYIHAPGTVLRCSICTEVVLRIMRMPDGHYMVDARGAAFFRV
jgi:Family of unknown function (DUF6510)